MTSKPGPFARQPGPSVGEWRIDGTTLACAYHRWLTAQNIVEETPQSSEPLSSVGVHRHLFTEIEQLPWNYEAQMLPAARIAPGHILLPDWPALKDASEKYRQHVDHEMHYAPAFSALSGGSLLPYFAPSAEWLIRDMLPAYWKRQKLKKDPLYVLAAYGHGIDRQHRADEHIATDRCGFSYEASKRIAVLRGKLIQPCENCPAQRAGIPTAFDDFMARLWAGVDQPLGRSGRALDYVAFLKLWEDHGKGFLTAYTIASLLKFVDEPSGTSVGANLRAARMSVNGQVWFLSDGRANHIEYLESTMANEPSKTYYIRGSNNAVDHSTVIVTNQATDDIELLKKIVEILRDHTASLQLTDDDEAELRDATETLQEAVESGEAHTPEVRTAARAIKRLAAGLLIAAGGEALWTAFNVLINHR